MDEQPREVTDPVELLAWFRALPHGTVLVNGDNHACQVRTAVLYHGAAGPGQFISLQFAGSDEPVDLTDEQATAELDGQGPFTVLWMPPVGGAS